MSIYSWLIRITVFVLIGVISYFVGRYCGVNDHTSGLIGGALGSSISSMLGDMYEETH